MLRTTCFLAAAVALASIAPARADDNIHVASALVKLFEQVEVPARETGVLDRVTVREGQMVEAGTPLAQIDDSEAQFEKRRAQLELLAAGKQADSDVKVRFSRKSLEVAEAELRRAVDSEKRFAKSVSQSELDQLRLIVEKTSLEIEQAQLELELAQAARELKEVDVNNAQHSIEQRRIVAPLAGFVSQVNRHQGEWVQPGQPIVRILRLDRLRAEGLVGADDVSGDLNGRRATLTVQLDGQPVQFTGRVAFVSPEIDPVNGQVRIWAEIDNPELKLRPGLHGSLVIDGRASDAPRR